jgi:hypothetical protein
MSAADFGEWKNMASAPRDGTRVLVEIRATEQGEAEVDLVRWAKPERDDEERWVSAESDPGMAIFYADAELSGWMPLPTPLPKLRTRRVEPAPRNRSDRLEGEGSGI